MLFFARKHSLLSTPFFEGFKDYHNHALPAVDDGIKSLDDSLAALDYLEQLKVCEVVLTPHVMSGINQSSEGIEAAYGTLKECYKGEINLSLASEYMLDSSFLPHYKNGVRMLYDKHLLVETSYISPPRDFDQLLFEIHSDGITPVIAHPERYQYMNQKQYHTLHESGYELQLNLLSFTEMYGPEVPKNTKYLLEKGLYNYVGTDLHRLGVFKSRINTIKLSSKHIDQLLAIRERER